MSLLKRQARQVEEARVRAEREQVEAAEEIVARRGANQLQLLRDDECPNCNEAMSIKKGTTLPLYVCIKCRVSLPCMTPSETAATDEEKEEQEEQRNNEQSMLDGKGEHVEVKQAQKLLEQPPSDDQLDDPNSSDGAGGE